MEVYTLCAVTLLLSHRCNLRCSYCYQSERAGPVRMSWSTARAALDLVLASAPARCAVELSGGEPTLEPALLRKCVEYVRSAAPPGLAVDCSLTTNGTLVDDDLLAFLADHDVGLDLSFDGVPAAQDLRGHDTFPTLDRLLQEVGRQHPEFFIRRVTVRMVAHAVTLPHLAASVRHFTDRGVRRIALAPCITTDSAWGPSDGEILRDQVDEVASDSLRHLNASGTLPVAFLAGRAAASEDRTASLQCAAVSGGCACVDAAGLVWGCPLFARSLRRLPPLAERAADLVSLGSVHDPALNERLAGLPERAQGHPLYSMELRRCGTRRCHGCEHAADCWICPAAICESGQGLDPHEVPAFHCAFSRVTLDARRRFRDLRAKAGAQQCPAELAEALRGVAAALRSAEPGAPTPRS